jgi:hypothetical protein
MKMFSLFGKKASGPRINDLVFARQEAKWNALLSVANAEPDTIFVAWFDESVETLQRFFTSHQVEAQLLTARQLHTGIIAGKPIVFIEHYPLREKELHVFSSLTASNITVYSSLDEAFFKVFGGERISQLLEKIGLDDNEAISHSMITKAIGNAQEKLAGKVTIDQAARSSAEWMQKNVGTILP